MKKLILLMILFSSSIIKAEEAKAEKTLEIKAHVVKIIMAGNKTYDLELREFAAVYHAEEKFSPCLKKAMEKNQAAILKISAFSLNVLECSVK
jgi:hypothetical protein